MGGYALLICRSRTEAIGLQAAFGAVGVPGRGRAPAASRTNRICGWAVRVSAAGGLAAHRLRQPGAAVPRCCSGVVRHDLSG